MIRLIMCYPAREEQILGKRGLFGPLAFAYLARHTPDYYKITLYDEWVGEKLNTETCNADLVAISAITPVINRAYEIGDKLKKRGITCVIGGPHVSAFLMRLWRILIQSSLVKVSVHGDNFSLTLKRVVFKKHILGR